MAKKPLKVCIVTSSFPRWENDDQGTFVIEVAKALINQGASVRVIGPHAPGSAVREDLNGIDVIRPRYAWPERFEILRRYRAGLPVILRKTSLAWLLIPLFMTSQFFALLLHTGDCDVIHANWTLSAFSAILVKRLRKIPVVVTVQGSDIYETRRIGWLRRVTRFVLSSCDRVLALSSSLATLTEQIGVPDEKIEISPNGVDVDFFTPMGRQKEKIILFVGSIIDRKGVNTLLDAAPRVLSELPDYRIVFIGEGPLESELQSRAVSFGLGDRIAFLGVKPPGDVRDWMQKAKVFVLPSLEEGLGVVLLEALACETPCIASAIGGIPDVIHSGVGLLVPPGNLQALEDALIKLLTDDDLWNSMHKATRDYVVSKFSWELISTNLIEIYTQLQQEV